MHGIILYTDGGSRPNGQYAGWGLHGYYYRKEAPKKGSGLTDHLLTTEGYLTKQAVQEYCNKNWPVDIVTPIHYIDGHGSFGYFATNNVAELTAAIAGLKHVLDFDVRHVKIIADSEYVVKGTNEHLDRWKRNNWLKADGLPPSNLELWKELHETREQLLNRGVTLVFEWIRGHNGLQGNVQADAYATAGIQYSRAQLQQNCIEIQTAEGYWKYKVEKHPFISHRRMYFNTLENSQVPGHYYIGEHGKDDDMLGKRISDGAYAFVMLDVPDPVLELLRTQQTRYAENIDSLIMARLDYLYAPDNHRLINKFQQYAFERKLPHRLDLYGLDDEPVTRELRPAKIAMRAIESLSDIAERLYAYLENKHDFVITDITAHIYDIETQQKKKETVETWTLKSDFIVGYSALDVQLGYNTKGLEQAIKQTLTLGIDLPDRNTLKRLEEYRPKISVITWKESEQAFRFATVIEAGNDKGIWAGVYSNLRIIQS